MAETKYFVGRVIKLGRLSDDLIQSAVLDPATVIFGKFRYTFASGEVLEVDGVRAVYGKLVKFIPEGQVKVVEERLHEVVRAEIARPVVAESPFVYVPSESGIAYPSVWRDLPTTMFERVFARLVEQKHADFFVRCRIEPVSDRVTFMGRLRELDRITGIDATVRPPNPLFDPVWEVWKRYLTRRQAAEVQFREVAASEEGIRSRLAELAEDPANEPAEERGPSGPSGAGESVLEGGVDAADAAVMMAIDGYGKAKVSGSKGKQRMVIRTEQNQVTFEVGKEGSNETLARETIKCLAKVRADRNLRHG